MVNLSFAHTRTHAHTHTHTHTHTHNSAYTFTGAKTKKKIPKSTFQEKSYLKELGKKPELLPDYLETLWRIACTVLRCTELRVCVCMRVRVRVSESLVGGV